MADNEPGDSWHTIFKHALLREFGGACAAAGSYIPGIDTIKFIDATAGKGKPSAFSKTSSPEIFAGFLSTARMRTAASNCYSE